jgi:hypothetical protein
MQAGTDYDTSRGDGNMADDENANRYWREVFKGAWRNTLRRVGWDPTKVILAIAAFIGSWTLGGIVFSATGAVLIGITALAPFIFVWGLLQAQADMYRDLERRQAASAAAGPRETNQPAIPKPDFDMWRHREKLSLIEAAQLWAGFRPSLSLGTRGSVKDTYAMLTGAIQKGELPFIPDGSIDPSARDTVRRMQQQNPHQNTQLTRAALKAFAIKYEYDPEFLRDRTIGAV